MTAKLDVFLATMKGFFESEIDAAGVEARLGSSPSGTARLALYAELVSRQKESVLNHFFRAARRAAEERAPGSWKEVLSGYLRRHRPTHWEPNHFARPMVEYLGAQAASNAVPAVVHELADYAWLRYVAMLAPHSASIQLEVDVFVREYAHDLVAYARDAETKTPASTIAPPASVRSTLLVCRSRTSGGLEVVRPSLAALVVVSEHASGVTVEQLPGGLTAMDLRTEEQALLDLGVLSMARRAAR